MTKAVVLLSVAAVAAAAAFDGPQELKYDNGNQAVQLAWFTGAGSWVGNDFDVSTLKTRHNVVSELKFFTSNNWPNNVWDGFRVALFAMSGGTPGSMIWPAGGTGKYVKPIGITGFKTFYVDHYLTAPAFLAAVEQYYNHPQCDPYFCDTNVTFLDHSWQRETNGPWTKLVGLPPYPYRNLMLRVTVYMDYSEEPVTPTSLGRVKALYY